MIRTPSRPALTPEPSIARQEMEARRLQAAALFDKGRNKNQVATRLGVSRTSAGRWHRAYHAGGLDSLKRHPTTGRPPRLTTAQRAQLLTMLRQSPRLHGFGLDYWTQQSAADLIAAKFGVVYNGDHVGRWFLSQSGVLRRRRRPRGAAAGGQG